VKNTGYKVHRDLLLSRRLSMMKFSRAISQVKWLSGKKTNVSKTICVLSAQLFDPADSPRELHHFTVFSMIRLLPF
jgi:hypothetical protein